MIELNEEEKRAIRALKRLAKKWPETLWLFSASGELQVMRAGPDGKPVTNSKGSMDQDYSVAVIDIENDGGDW